MKRYLVLLGLLFLASSAFAWVSREPISEYKTWRSSWIGTGNFSGVIISSDPIIFHMVVGSATANSGFGDFTLLQSTGLSSMSSDASTKTIVHLDNNNYMSDKIGVIYDILVTTTSFFNKSGAGNIGYEWDYYRTPKYNQRNPND